MENKGTIVPAEGKEMNFFDLCVACWQALVRACAACWRVLARMIRLTYRYWYIVITLVLLAIGFGYYYSRYDNTTFRVNAVALLNGPTIQQFEQAFAPMRSTQLLPENAPIEPYLYGGIIRNFNTYRVIDALGDGTADYIDFKNKSKANDTVNVQMQDRLCLQFRIKVCHMTGMQDIEEKLMATLNADPAMQLSYQAYLKNLQEEAAFNHRQAAKLDSLTSAYYFNNPAISMADAKAHNGGVAFYGDRRIRLFLKEIYDQQAHMQRTDYRLQLATAPVVLENHFAVDPKPVHSRRQCLVFFFLFGWIAGCVIAEVIDKRKAICAWLKA